MKQQALTSALTMEVVLHQLDPAAEDPKLTLTEFLRSSGHVATALSFCWAVHIFL